MSGHFSEVVTARWGKLFNRPQILSNDILSFWVSGSLLTKISKDLYLLVTGSWEAGMAVPGLKPAPVEIR